MPNVPAGNLTALLRDWRAGDGAAAEQLLPIIYEELHTLAARHLRGERPGHTLQPTDLVSEAYLRLSQGAPEAWNDRVHFFAIAARTMRQILVDHARKRLADKRGGGERPVTFEEDRLGAERPDEILAVDAALHELAARDERKARVVELYYFAGLSQAEIAIALDVHVNTILRDLRFAEAWLHRYLKS